MQALAHLVQEVLGRPNFRGADGGDVHDCVQDVQVDYGDRHLDGVRVRGSGLVRFSMIYYDLKGGEGWVWDCIGDGLSWRM